MSSILNSLQNEIEEKMDGKMVCLLIYDSSKHKLNATEFHKRCDNKGPTLTVIYGVQNVVYGGFTSVSWSVITGFKRDEEAFLFTNKDNHLHIYNIKSDYEDTAIYCKDTFGPCFGGNALFSDFLSFRHEPKSTDGIISLNGDLASYSFTSFGKANDGGHKGFAGGNNKIHRLEVYTVESDELESEWLPILKSPEELRESLKQKQKPGLEGVPLNILLVGQISSGKSSFINSALSAMSGTILQAAIASGSSYSETNKFAVYELIPSTDTTSKSKKVRLFDVRGVQNDRGMKYELDNILQGELKPGYEFPDIEIPVDSMSLKENMSRRINMVCFVIDSSLYDVMTDDIKEKIEDMKKITSRLGVKRVVVLTKIDESFHNLCNDPGHTVKNRSLLSRVKKVARDFGINQQCVFPVVNYTSQSKTDRVRDKLILHALTSMVEHIEAQESAKTSNADAQAKWMDRHRSVDAKTIVQKQKEDIRTLVDSSLSEENPVRILVVGSSGSGKSSFINSISSSLAGRMFRRINATRDSPSGESSTVQYMAYQLKMSTSNIESKIPVRICDMPGFIHAHSGMNASGYSIQTSDILYTIQGHIKSPYKFVKEVSTEGEPKKQVNGLCFVVSVTEIDNEQTARRFNDVFQQIEANEINIPYIVILSKIDKQCPEIKKVYQNPSIADAAKSLCDSLPGVNLSDIFPVVNYIHEADTESSMDMLILDAFKSLLHRCIDYIETVLDAEDDKIGVTFQQRKNIYRLSDKLCRIV